ncbi:MAG: hypothetical protein LBU19_05170 [Treponema sp.]|nr:hypothetical protein [Treponema sp.]
MNGESILAQITLRFGTTEDLGRDNPELLDGEFCIEVLPGGGWLAKRGKQENGSLLRWQELPYFNIDNVHGLRAAVSELAAAIAREAGERAAADARLRAGIGAEAETRAAADAGLWAAIAAETQARQEAGEASAAAAAQEAQTRAAADAGLRAGTRAEARARQAADAALAASASLETQARQAKDKEHAALAAAHGAAIYPAPHRIPLYDQSKKLHTGGPAAAYWDAVRFHEFHAILNRIADLETAVEDLLVTEEGFFLTSESGALISL